MNSRENNAIDLKQACVEAAHRVIAQRGIEGLSMREVARDLNVSHQAPYRHFPSRDHLLAEVMRRCFLDFARHLEAPETVCDVDEQLSHMGQAYLAYAHGKPLEYQLMFGTPWPEPAIHTKLVDDASATFNLLRDCMRQKHEHTQMGRAQTDLDALFVWSALHGMASICHANVMPHLQLDDITRQAFTEDLMKKIGIALGGDVHKNNNR